MIARPSTAEHSAYFGKYVDLVADRDVLVFMQNTHHQVVELFSSLSEEQQNYRYAPDKWTPRDVLLHIIDTERGMCYRALRLARADAYNFPVMQEDVFAAYGNANTRSVGSLLNEYRSVREGTVTLFRDSIPPERAAVIGELNSQPISARALLWIMAGHEQHHLKIIRERYLNINS